jgi:hypothetical protein
MSLDAAYTRRVTHVRAVQVTHANLAAVVAWIGPGASTWGATVRVPDVEYGAAGVTEWIVKVGPRFQVWTDEAFRAEFVPQMSIYQPVGER